MHWISDPHAWVALATLTGLEIVLGIDNIIFISILAGKLPQRETAEGPDPRSRVGHDLPGPAPLFSDLDHEADPAASSPS